MNFVMPSFVALKVVRSDILITANITGNMEDANSMIIASTSMNNLEINLKTK